MGEEKILKQMEVLKQIRVDLQMNRREFSDYMGIPLRTLEEWEAGRRSMPDYVLRLITYYVYIENGMKEKYDNHCSGREDNDTK